MIFSIDDVSGENVSVQIARVFALWHLFVHLGSHGANVLAFALFYCVDCIRIR